MARVIALLALVLSTGCAGRGNEPPHIDPVVVATAVHGALIVAEQAQAIEAAMFAIDSDPGVCHLSPGSSDCIPPDTTHHCRIQTAFGRFADTARTSLAIVFDITYPGADRSRALRALVAGSAEVVDLVSPRLSSTEQIALRAGLAAGIVAVNALSAQRMPVEAPPEILAMRDDVVGVLQRMSRLAAQECPNA